jgi:hypothetical protein
MSLKNNQVIWGIREMHLPLLEWKIKKTSYINGNND